MFLHESLKVDTFPLRLEGRKCLNPSIAVHKGKLEIVIRTVNYSIDPNGRYVMPPEDGEVIKTTNFLADFSSGEISNVREIVDPTPRLQTLVRGYEDFRLASAGSERFASATVRDRREDMLCQIAVCTIADDGTVTRSDVQLPVPGRNEKNWMPRGGDRLRFLYDVVTWVDFNPRSGKATLRPYFQSPFAPELTNARGGAMDGNLAIIHEVDASSGKRVYRHRFVLYNEDDEIEAVSPLFSFQLVGIEFCAGLACHEGKVWMTYGVHDAEAFAACVDEAELLAWIRKAPINAAAIEPPRFITTTLTNSQEKIIGPALESVVDWADACIVVDTGVKDGTLAVADQVCGPKLVVRQFEWRRDFAAARSFALEAAGELAKERGWSNAWAVTLDTDERLLEGPPAALPAVDHILTPDESKGYHKWRLFRLPAKGRYRGRTHELYADGGTHAYVSWMRFSELGKSEADNQRKFERDLQILKEETKAYPKDARWWFYLGETNRNLKKYKPATEAYTRCAELSGWDEEAAWASYQAATCYVELKDFGNAIRSCSVGLLRQPGMPELAWLAGWSCLQIRDWAKAEMWARLAIAHGCFGKRIERRGFRYHLGMYDGPYSVLKEALQGLGRAEEAKGAEELRARAEKLRERGASWT
jgi:tetratricopeptide (TPR) repeat protein